MPSDSLKYFHYDRGYDFPPTLISKREYQEATAGCSKGIHKCDWEYKKKLKFYKTQYKNNNPDYILDGKMIKPDVCRKCQDARIFEKSCAHMYDNHFYGYAKESENGSSVYFHWSNNWLPNFGTSKVIKNGKMTPYGVPDKSAYDDLFKLSLKPENQKVLTPKHDEFISGYIEENKHGFYKGKLQWTKWFRHSLTFLNFTRIVRTAIENKSMQCIIQQPQIIIARMVYDQNQLIPKMDMTPKTPCNCEPISREHWILACVTMVAFLGIRPKNREIFQEYGGLSNVGTLNYFDFLENIDNPLNLMKLTTQEIETITPTLTLHPSDFSIKGNDSAFWKNASENFKNIPFLKKNDRPICHSKKRCLDYNMYRDRQSIDFLPYYNQAPYYNYSNQTKYFYDYRQDARKRLTDQYNHEYYQSFKRTRGDFFRSEYADELRTIIREDVQRMTRKILKKRRMYHSDSEDVCRYDSGRERSSESSYLRDRIPTYDELLDKVKEMEREKDESELIAQAMQRRTSQRWKTESSESDSDF